MSKCKHCQHSFKPRYVGLGIRTIRDQLLACSSQIVRVVHNGRRYVVCSFSRCNYSWTLWGEVSSEPMTLARMQKELRKRDNWDCLRSYGLDIHLEAHREEDVWAKVLRIEDTRASIDLECDEEMENSEGEVLIHVHTEADAEAAYERGCQ